MRTLIAIAIFIFVQPSFANDVCNEDAEMAAYTCAKKGDFYAAGAIYDLAMANWSKSCELGLESSCDLVDKYTKHKQFFKEDYVHDLKDIIAKDPASFQMAVRCTKGYEKISNCIEAASDMLTKDIESAKMILKDVCEKDLSTACYDYGRALALDMDIRGALSAYQKGCQLENTQSCNMVSFTKTRLDVLNKIEEAKQAQQQAVVSERLAKWGGRKPVFQ